MDVYLRLFLVFSSRLDSPSGGKKGENVLDFANSLLTHCQEFTQCFIRCALPEQVTVAICNHRWERIE